VGGRGIVVGIVVGVIGKDDVAVAALPAVLPLVGLELYLSGVRIDVLFLAGDVEPMFVADLGIDLAAVFDDLLLFLLDVALGRERIVSPLGSTAALAGHPLQIGLDRSLDGREERPHLSKVPRGRADHEGVVVGPPAGGSFDDFDDRRHLFFVRDAALVVGDRKHGPVEAAGKVSRGLLLGHNHVVDADIKGFFDNIDQKRLTELVAKRVSDRRVQKLLRKWLKAGVMEAGGWRESLAGTPQGGVISPLPANIYLHELDRRWRAEGQELGELVRYADDFVVLCKTGWKAKAARRLVEQQLGLLGLELHPDKTKVVDLWKGRGRFEFLGCTLRKKRSILRNPRRAYLRRWPSPKAMKRVRSRIHELTDRRRAGAKLPDIIAQLNPVLRGWGNYFRTGNADRKFNQVDHYVRYRLCAWLRRRGGQRTRFCLDKWPFERFIGMGLHRLLGTVCYPAQAAPLRPSVSRVRENRTHGLTGEPVGPTSQ
jgi:group II intron reverse transcriptase/maturase